MVAMSLDACGGMSGVGEVQVQVHVVVYTGPLGAGTGTTLGAAPPGTVRGVLEQPEPMVRKVSNQVTKLV